MANITGEALFRDFKTFTSSDPVGVFVQITSAAGGQGRAITVFNIVNNDTALKSVELVYEVYDGVSWKVAMSKAYGIPVGETLVALEFIVPLTPRADGNHDRIRARVNNSVTAGGYVYVFVSGAQFV